MESSDLASYTPTLHCAQAVCTEAFCSLEVENSDSEGEEEEQSQPSLGLSNLDSPALQVMHWGKDEGEGDREVKSSNAAGIAPLHSRVTHQKLTIHRAWLCRSQSVKLQLEQESNRLLCESRSLASGTRVKLVDC